MLRPYVYLPAWQKPELVEPIISPGRAFNWLVATAETTYPDAAKPFQPSTIALAMIEIAKSGQADFLSAVYERLNPDNPTLSRQALADVARAIVASTSHIVE